MKAQVLHLWI